MRWRPVGDGVGRDGRPSELGISPGMFAMIVVRIVSGEMPSDAGVQAVSGKSEATAIAPSGEWEVRARGNMPGAKAYRAPPELAVRIDWRATA